jgi:carboxymethylenebutenolidase
MKLEVGSRWQTLGPMQAFVASPALTGRYPGVIVFQEIFGVNSHIRDVCARVASHGYIAIAPDIFHRTARQLDLGYTQADVTRGREHKNQATMDGLLADTRACIAWLKAAKDFSGAIGCVGFCFGGHVAFIAATLPEIKATVSFYGGGIGTSRPGGGPPSVELAPLIKGRLRLIYGEDDKGIPQTEVEAIALKLMAAKVDFMVTTYSRAGHGFACDQRESYNAQAADYAWKETYTMLDKVLRGG